ncbi:MAG: YhbY family RNA-binding protein [Verrucomicrobiota bacterium]
MLSSADKKKLRGVAQRLPAHVHVGKAGVSETLITEMDALLKRDGLVKAKFIVGGDLLKSAIADLEERTQSECVGSVGKTAVFFRERVDT